MTKEYGFEVDLDNYTQDGDVRIFDVKADKEKVDAFIEGLGLFFEKELHSGCVCDCEKNHGGSCKNPKAYLSGGCK